MVSGAVHVGYKLFESLVASAGPARDLSGQAVDLPIEIEPADAGCIKSFKNYPRSHWGEMPFGDKEFDLAIAGQVITAFLFALLFV